MFKRLLIANRGEAAVRIIRTCRELGVETVVVYSELDANTLPVRLADQAICIGPAPAEDSYLNIPRVLSAAEIASVEAVHPGYGFLAESPEFAEAVELCKLKFIGPKSETIRQANDRLATRSLARELGVPVLPGSDAELAGPDEAKRQAEAVGYPVVLKSARHSLRLWTVRKDKDLEMTLRMAQGEAKALSSDPRVYLERFLEDGRHIEVQVLADETGKIVSVLDRESSVRYRLEKIIDEAPAPMIPEAKRNQLSRWAIQIAEALKFRNAGTVEFLRDPAGEFYFMGVRPCLQAAHSATEVLADGDLVAEQLRLASGEPVSSTLRTGFDQDLPHVIQCRVNAEDADREFMPTAGLVTGMRLPGGPGIRVDTHCFAGYRGSDKYDRLVVKIIAWDHDRATAIARMERALRETAIEGVVTTLEFQQRLLRLGSFRKGELSLMLVDREMFGSRQ